MQRRLIGPALLMAVGDVHGGNDWRSLAATMRLTSKQGDD